MVIGKERAQLLSVRVGGAASFVNTTCESSTFADSILIQPRVWYSTLATQALKLSILSSASCSPWQPLGIIRRVGVRFPKT